MEELKDKNGLTEKEFLAHYSDKGYDKPSVTADILVLGSNSDFSGFRILLVKRGGHPFLGSWALPGGFVRKDETAYQAAARELSEETGLQNVYLEQIYAFTNPRRDPRTRVMSIAYLALVCGFEDVAGSDDAADAAWFDMTVNENGIRIFSAERGVEIFYGIERGIFQNGKIRYENWVAKSSGGEKLAFDHIEIVIESLLKLKSNFYNSDLAFNMIGDFFTLPDLQSLYELVLGKKLYKTNFRAMVADKIQATGEKRKSMTSGKMSAEYVYDSSSRAMGAETSSE